jgi:hypothetical protein
VTFFGERNSGTNFLEAMIKTNFRVHVTTLYGSKHWWQTADKMRAALPRSPGTAVVVVFRHPITWIDGMYRKWHHIQTPWVEGNVKRMGGTQFNLYFAAFVQQTPFVSSTR